VISEHAGELPRFGSKAGKPGFVGEVKSLLSEFVRYEVTAEALSEASGKIRDSLLSDKLRELAAVYGWFRERCGETQITEDDIYNAMCPLVRESKRLAGSTLYFDGYTGFTPTQYNLIRELMGVCRDLVITITVDPEEIQDGGGRTECFRMSRETYDTMRRIAESLGMSVSVSAESDDAAADSALAHLSRSLFRRGAVPFRGEVSPSVRLVRAGDRRGEVHAVVREIAGLVRKQGLRYREIGIVCGDVAGYGEELRREFDTAGIPFFLDRTTEVTDNCLTDYIRSLLRMLLTDMRTDQCIRWLKNPINGYDEETLGYLENFLTARGVRGLAMWKRGLYGDYGGRRVTKAAECSRIAKQIAEMLVPLAEVMNRASAGVREKTEALYRFLRERQVYERMTELSEEIASERVSWSRRRAMEYKAIYRAVIGLLDRLYTVLPEPSVTLREYSELLDAGFAELRLGVIPPEPDCVMVGDCKRSRFSTVRALYFLGVNEGLVPGSGHGSELLSRQEREHLKSEFQISLADTEKESVDSEEFNILLALQKPTETLVVSWCLSDGEGRNLAESYVIRRIRNLLPGITEEEADGRGKSFFERIATDGGREELLTQYAAASRGTAREEEERAALGALYQWYCVQRDRPGDGLVLDAAMLADAERGFFRQPTLSEEVAAMLYPKDTEYSVSRLETYAQCPFRHFATYGLTAEERVTFEPTVMDNGSVYHAILDYAGRMAAEAGEEGKSVDTAMLRQFLREGAESVRALPEYECFFEDGRSRHLFETLLGNLEFMAPYMAEQLREGRYRIAKTEDAFSEELGGFRFRGKIDRIDRSDIGDTAMVKIVDYKTSGRDFKRELALGGIDIQLPLYLRIEENRLRKEGVRAIAAAALYLPLSVPLVSGLPGEGGEEEVRRKAEPDGLLLTERPDVALPSDRYLSRLDVNFEAPEPGYRSRVIPIGVSKKGAYSGGERCTSEEMTGFLDAVEALAVEEAGRIERGDIEIRPYRYGTSASAKTGCDYCPYAGLCHKEAGTELTYRVIGAQSGEEAEE